MQNETLHTVSTAVAKISPPWVVTLLAWGDANLPRILLVLSILYTAAQLYLAVRKILRKEHHEH